MRRRRPKKTTKEERARGRRAVQEYRARQRQRLALHLVVVDAQVLDLLVARHYLMDDQVFDKGQVNRALSKLLWDIAHPLH